MVNPSKHLEKQLSDALKLVECNLHDRSWEERNNFLSSCIQNKEKIIIVQCIITQRDQNLHFARSIELCSFVAPQIILEMAWQIKFSMNNGRNKATIKYEIIIWRTVELFLNNNILNFTYCLLVNPLPKVKVQFLE